MYEMCNTWYSNVKTAVEIYNVSREIQMFFSLIVLGHTTAWASAGKFGFQIDH